MGKTKDTRRLADNQAMAVCNSIRSSSRKLNLVAQTINTVIEIAQCYTYAFFENNHKLNIDKLVVAEAYTGNGIVMKRMHARGRGRGARVLKPFSKLTIVVAERGE